MPYAANVYTVPPGTEATTLTPIDSSDYNAFVADIEAAQNAARPVVAGGTGGTSVITGWDGLAKKGADVPSGSSINLTTATGPSVTITGTTTITAVTLAEGSFRIVRAAEIFIWEAGASLLVNGSTTEDLTTAANDLFLVRGGAGGVVSVASLGAVAVDTSAIEADIAALESNVALNAFKIADLEGVRLNMAGGIADAYDSETDVDTTTSTNESYDAANDLYAPTTSETAVTINAYNSGPTNIGSNLTIVSRTTALVNGVTVHKVGIYSTNAATYKVKIVKRNSAGNYDVVVDESFSHPGGGFADKTLASPYSVPGSGNYYVAAYNSSSTTVDLAASVSRASASGDITGTGQTINEDTNTPFALRYAHTLVVNNMTLVSNAFTATAVPTAARVAVFIDPQVSITINTDFTAEVSRDGGTTWTAVTLVLVSNPVGTVEQYEGTADISGQPSGSSMKYRLKTLNNKDIDVTGIVFQWS